MPIIILGLLVVAGLIAYMYFTSHSERFISKDPGREETKKEQEDQASVIYLPNDIEKEKKKRNVKTGK
ncbi:hypothetical protein LI177_01245 [bacterium 210820-DFI.6.37]|nr:hypothetical protein [bacterium 210820-DFI.6.37]